MNSDSKIRLNRKINIIYPAVLLLLLGFHLVNNYIYIKNDNSLLGYNELTHINMGVEWVNRLDEFIRRPLMGFPPVNFHLYGYYPPLFYISSGLMCFIFGHTYLVMVMTNAIFLGILLISVYGIAKVMLNEKAGLISAVTLSLYPAIFGSSRSYNLDIALSAMVSLSIYLLLCSDNFSKRNYSIFTGVACGLGMLAERLVFPLFIFGPLLYVGYQAFFRKPNDKLKNKAKLINFGLFSFIAAAISLPFYWNWFRNFFYWSMSNSVSDVLLSKRLLDAVLFYPLVLFNSHLFPFFCLVLVVALPSFFFSKNKYKYMILLWIIIPYLFFGLIENKQYVYSIPFLAAFAIISAMGISSIRLRLIRIAVIFLVVLLGGIQFYRLWFNIDMVPHIGRFSPWINSLMSSRKIELNLPFIDTDYSLYAFDFAKPPAKLDWFSILRPIEETNREDLQVKIGLVSRPSGGYLGIRYFIRLRNPSFKVVPFTDDTHVRFLNELNTFDYLLYISKVPKIPDLQILEKSAGVEYFEGDSLDKAEVLIGEVFQPPNLIEQAHIDAGDYVINLYRNSLF